MDITPQQLDIENRMNANIAKDVNTVGNNSLLAIITMPDDTQATFVISSDLSSATSIEENQASDGLSREIITMDSSPSNLDTISLIQCYNIQMVI